MAQLKQLTKYDFKKGIEGRLKWQPRAETTDVGMGHDHTTTADIVFSAGYIVDENIIAQALLDFILK